jgi:hypothetical protein
VRPRALARKLLVAGIPGQQPVEVFSQVCTYDNGTEIHTEELRGCVTYRSLYAMARTTLEEGDRPLHRARFKERPQIAFPLQPGAAETLASSPSFPADLAAFFGAGTIGLVADQLQRDCIGIELNPTYAEMARRRISADSALFAEVAAE